MNSIEKNIENLKDLQILVFSTDIAKYQSLSRETVESISKMKNEPKWMLDFRLRSYDIFMKKPMPNWGGDLGKIDYQDIVLLFSAKKRER